MDTVSNVLAFDPVFESRLNDQLVKWEQENALMEEYFEKAHEMLIEPNIDVLSAILYLGYLNQIQMNVYVTAKNIQFIKIIEKSSEIKKQYRAFLDKANELSEQEIKNFSNLSAPIEEHEFISWFDKLVHFYKDAFEQYETLDQEFYDLVFGLLDQSDVFQVDPNVLSILNAFDSQGGDLIDKTFIKRGGFAIYKKIEMALAKWLTGEAPPILLPGTNLVSESLGQMRSALANYLTSIQESIVKKMEAVMQKNEAENRLFMSHYTTVLRDYGTKRMQTIQSVLDLYYEATLTIIERVSV